MHTLLPALARAAAVGAVFGLSGELASHKPDGVCFAISTISAVALRAIGYYLGAGTAVGVLLGTVTGALSSASSLSERNLAAGALFGGALGYLADLAGPFTHLVVLL